jgi:predicted ester cyclase/predicted small secreted protein
MVIYNKLKLKDMRKIVTGMAVIVSAFLLSACNSKTGSAVNGSDSTATALARNKQVALSADDAFNKKDVDAIVKDYAPDFVEYGNGEYKPMKNLDSIKINLKGFLAAFPDFKGENLQAVAQGDTVIVTGTWSGTFKNNFMGMKPTQKSFKAPEADIFSFNKDGKITSHRAVQSETTYFFQLGIPMPKK